MANYQARMFLTYVSPMGRALVDKRLYLPGGRTSNQKRREAAGVTAGRRGYQSKGGVVLARFERAMELGRLPAVRDGLAALGMRYVLDVPGGTTVSPFEPTWTSPEYQGPGRPREPKLRGWAAPDHGAAL